MRITRVVDVVPKVVVPRIQQQHHHHHHPHEKNHVQQLENINEKASQPPQQPQQQHAWTQGFEKLLEDPLGLRAFAVSLMPFFFFFVQLE